MLTQCRLQAMRYTNAAGLSMLFARHDSLSARQDSPRYSKTDVQTSRSYVRFGTISLCINSQANSIQVLHAGHVAWIASSHLALEYFFSNFFMSCDPAIVNRTCLDNLLVGESPLLCFPEAPHSAREVCIRPGQCARLNVVQTIK